MLFGCLKLLKLPDEGFVAVFVFNWTMESPDELEVISVRG